MRTDELITVLARGVTPIERTANRRALASALAGGVVVTALLVLLPWYGLNPRLGADLHEPMFWVKWGFGLALSAAAWPAVRSLGTPGRAVPLGHRLAAVAPFGVLWALGALVWLQADPEARRTLVQGVSWRTCALSIVAMSAPLLVAALLAFRRTAAPTRPAMAGAALGLLSGGLGSTLYALHCPELAAPFVATWYVLGALLCAALGALAGARLLRW